MMRFLTILLILGGCFWCGISRATPIWLQSDHLLLPIETPPETATALFQKNGIHYLMFNQPDIAAPNLPETDFIHSFQKIPQSAPITLFSFELNPTYNAALLHPTSTNWTLEMAPAQPVFTLIKGKITPTELVVQTPLAQASHWIDLKESGEKILVVPFQNNTGGLPKRIDFLRLSLLKSAQGLAFLPKTPLQIQQTPTHIRLTGETALASSNAFFPLFLPSSDVVDFKAQRARLIRYASLTGRDDLPLFYQHLGILSLLNGQYASADAYMRQAPDIHPFWPAFNALMRHQNQQAAVLLNAITDVPEITYLQHLLAGEKQPIPAFLSQLPQHMQRPLLQMGLQNALMHFDIPLAQTYLTAWQKLPPTKNRLRLQNWMQHWMRLAGGDKTTLSVLKEQTPPIFDSTHPLWNHLFENAPTYSLNDRETLALFEEVRTFMEPNLTPRARQQLAAAYQRINLPQEAEKIK